MNNSVVQSLYYITCKICYPFQVDQGNLAVLETVDDVHVLTGALKLFFRELKEPLIPWECVDKLLRACRAGSSPAKKVSTKH